jgi:hypothetical protein
MVSDKFKVFSSAVRTRFAEMSQENLFVVDIDKDLLWESYLKSFPPGTDPMFRKRTEHDCSCCRSFIKNMANVVAIQNGAISTIWDLNGLPEPYQTVAFEMSKLVKKASIRDAMFTKNEKHGQESNFELIDEIVHTWNHFNVIVPKKYVKSSPAEAMGEIRTAHDVFERSLKSIKIDDVKQVLDLVEQGTLYRGNDFRPMLSSFMAAQYSYATAFDGPPKDNLAWAMTMSVGNSVTHFKNSVIGTLVQDIADGVDLEKAVRSYEVKTAPSNYKRPTALITQKMIESAMDTIKSLGIERSLERRFTRLSDVSVNSVLFVDNSVRGKMKDGIKDLLMKEVKVVPVDASKAEQISIDDFIANVLPKTTSLKAFITNSNIRNFASLTAPVHEDTKSLFKWDNDFAWSYDGNVTDSIKDRVKNAGGLVEGVSLRVSLGWSNYDDLDLHVREPNGNVICYYNKSDKLDVDMNAGSGNTREPVENVRWVGKLKDGNYAVIVNNYNRRESINVGFTIEVESNLGINELHHTKALADRKTVNVCDIQVKGGAVVSVKPAVGIASASASREQWGVKTMSMVNVDSVVLSPNHWGEGIGAKHWFFMLEGCKNPLPTRGIYNEFLHSELDKHRKVFEVLGDKTKCQPTEDQISGVGFTIGRKDQLTVHAVGDKINKTYTINF